MNPRIVAAAVAALLAVGTNGRAQQPRLGRIAFPTSGRVEAQPEFILGVLYLHSFEYDSAARHFRAAQRLDPDFAMAWWGEAMTYTHPVWMQQDSGAARTALSHLGPSRATRRARAQTEREKRWMDAVEVLYGAGRKEQRDSLYAREMERFSRDYPGDHEVRSFHALALLGLAHTGRDVPTYMRAAALVEDVFRENPEHPGALHYLIHAYDDPVHAPLGLRAARAYSEVAPGAAHAQHMTSHIFVAMGMWEDVERANLSAWEATNRRNGHYTHWLSYGYLQQGRRADSERFVDAIIRDAARDPTAYKLGYRNIMLAGFVVDAEDLSGRLTSHALDSVRFGMGQTNAAQLQLARGLAAVTAGRRAIAATALDSIYTLIAAGRAEAQRRYLPWLGSAEVMADLLRAVRLADISLLDSAIAVARNAAERESALPFEFGPPETVKPPYELLGELLLRAQRPAEARGAFTRALARTPNRPRSVLGAARAAAASGDPVLAAQLYSQFLASTANADAPRAAQREAESYVAASRGGPSR